MNKFCFIYNIEQTWNDNVNSHYDIMSILVAQSIREIYPEVDVYASFMSNINTKLDDKIKYELEKLQVHISYTVDNIDETKDNYYLRHKCIQNFLHLLNIYDNLVYVDIDTYLLKEIPQNYFQNNSIYIEDVPYNIKKYLEQNYINNYDINLPLFYNWFQIINNTNKFIYDIELDDISKHSDVQITKNILNSELFLIDNDQPYYPKKTIKDNSFIIHYDTFGEEGSLIFIKDIYPKLFFKIKTLLKYKYNVILKNDPKFWAKELLKWKNY